MTSNVFNGYFHVQNFVLNIFYRIVCNSMYLDVEALILKRFECMTMITNFVNSMIIDVNGVIESIAMNYSIQNPIILIFL